MALLGECIFLVVPIVKLCWFAFFQPNFTLEDVQYFYPLSALNITGYKGIAVWFIYPLQVLNVFEGINIMASGYGVGLLLWVVCVMFFTLNIS